MRMLPLYALAAAATAGVLGATTPAQAQVPVAKPNCPANRVCAYDSKNFQDHLFTVAVKAGHHEIPAKFDNRITSIVNNTPFAITLQPNDKGGKLDPEGFVVSTRTEEKDLSKYEINNNAESYVASR